jgi:hypothetical protein
VIASGCGSDPRLLRYFLAVARELHFSAQRRACAIFRPVAQQPDPQSGEGLGTDLSVRTSFAWKWLATAAAQGVSRKPWSR